MDGFSDSLSAASERDMTEDEFTKNSLEEKENANDIPVTPGKNSSSITTPYEGMEFKSYKDAKEYYIEYGRRNGFTIRVRSTNKTLVSLGEVTAAYTVCSREGKHEKKENVEGIDKKGKRCSIIKCGCDTKMHVLFNEENNIWTVMAFSDDHNHKFVSPTKRIRMRSNRYMPEGVKDMTEVFNLENIEVGKVPLVFGGATIGFNKRDCWNHLFNVRHKNLEVGDAQSIMDYLHMRQSENPQFFYRVQVDEHGRAVNFFWVDARSRMSYEQFGEVVFFDTTYRTNKYDMPFAPFTGVNHHYQTIQFGCALLQDETEITFQWLFHIWLESMGEKHPLAIITDQDTAMALAIKKVFPNSTSPSLPMAHKEKIW
ncbi:protein FAR1-RELATED SEQUENCE 5-like [Papaver somniferum]|uniref:protein FAR1-RELATED SEQUENCE 5-like n=1 Tax=Papaver somniferum TaxID=3469 RepID=UPI000E6F6493|nr:protein FAR1-RELATED SEQUENCE 5-like [Papaver somniferum]